MERCLASLLIILTSHMLQGQQVIWSDDFSDPALWNAHHSDSVDLDWQVGLGLTNAGPSPLSPIQSTTAANGYAMLDSDGGPGSPTGPEEDCWLTCWSTIDLSSAVFPILRFQANYRHAFPGRCSVVVSTDGGFTYPVELPVFIGVDNGDSIANPTTVELDLRQAIWNNPFSVNIGFRRVGPQGYSWFIDDIEVADGPALPCNIQFIVDQATDGLGQPTPFLLDLALVFNGGNTPQSYFWDFGDGTTTNSPWVSHTYSTNGPYQICATVVDIDGCASTFCDSIMVDNTGMFSREEGFTVQLGGGATTIEESLRMGELRIAPNPAADLLLVGGLAPDDLIRITEASGREVLHQRVSTGSIDISILKPGSYLLWTTGGTKRFVKH